MNASTQKPRRLRWPALVLYVMTMACAWKGGIFGPTAEPGRFDNMAINREKAISGPLDGWTLATRIFLAAALAVSIFGIPRSRGFVIGTGVGLVVTCAILFFLGRAGVVEFS